jgi:hypothetical protein
MQIMMKAFHLAKIRAAKSYKTENKQMKRLNQIILLLLLITITTSSCGVFGKSKKDKSCMCPSRKVVG